MMEAEILKVGAAYIRVSDERQDEYSPDSQLKKIREYAEKEHCIIPDEYVFYDDGISGKSVKKRGDFNRMIAMSKEKTRPFDVIYVWKFSRFARNQEESMVYKNLLRKKGVSVVSVSEPIPEGHYGTLIERIIEWMDEFYLINLGTEVQRGMTEKASRGEPICPPPFGYIMREGKYYPDEESGKADIVREIFESYAAGGKQWDISRQLGQRGIRTQHGNMPEKRWIEYILNNSCYIGKIRYSTDGTRSVSKRKLDNENIMVVDGHHEPLISTELWDKVQKRLAQQKSAYPKYAKRDQPVPYLLKGLVRCSACGGTMTRASAVSGKSKVPTMQCCNYARGKCHVSHSVTMPRIEAALIEGLKQAVGEQNFVIAPRVKAPTSNAVDYDKLIVLEERRLVRARDAYLAEIDTLEQYSANKKEIAEKIADLRSRKQMVVTETIDQSAFAEKVMSIVEFIERDDVSISAKSEALHSIIDKIVFEKAKGNIAIYFHDIQSY